jgi:hypothetical protein
LSSDPTTEAWKAQLAVNRAVRRIWNFQPWNFRRRTHTFVTVADQSDYPLGQLIGRPYSILSSAAPYKLRVKSRYNLDRQDPQLAMEGDPYIAVLSGQSPVVVQPTSTTVISAVSASNSDTTQKVLVKGLVSGQEDYEELDLNGTTTVYTTKSFSEITAITKSARTEGSITIASGSTTLITLGPLDIAPVFRVLSLYPVVQSVLTITVRHFSPPPKPFTNFYESVMIPEDWDYVVDQWAFTLALQSKGQDQNTEYNSQLMVAVKMLEEDMATEEEVISDEPVEIDDAGSGSEGGFRCGVPSGHGVMES